MPSFAPAVWFQGPGIIVVAAVGGLLTALVAHRVLRGHGIVSPFGPFAVGVGLMTFLGLLMMPPAILKLLLILYASLPVAFVLLLLVRVLDKAGLFRPTLPRDPSSPGPNHTWHLGGRTENPNDRRAAPPASSGASPASPAGRRSGEREVPLEPRASTNRRPTANQTATGTGTPRPNPTVPPIESRKGYPPKAGWAKPAKPIIPIEPRPKPDPWRHNSGQQAGAARSRPGKP